jgi:D-tyrosyl-tRNA(Tyr) deacylase
VIAVVQRVSRAEVRVAGEVVGRIGRGLLVLVAIEKGDGDRELDWFSDKVLQMRIFEDSDGRMNRSALDVGAGILVVSQFTLAGDLGRGRRPGFDRAAPPGEAEPLYRRFVERLRRSPLAVETGRFREFMEVELVNDGPVTFVLGGRPQ